MFRFAVTTVLAALFALQPLSIVLCVDECEMHRSKPTQQQAARCVESNHSPLPPAREEPTHDGSDCRHPVVLCARLQTPLAEQRALDTVQLATLPSPTPSFAIPLSSFTSSVRRAETPPGVRLRVVPLRI
jgi:hypothetical protein